jgi:mRNA interferase MazF
MPARRPEITVAYLTTHIRFARTEVRLTPAADGVAEDCVVNLDSINTVPKDLLVQRVSKLSAAKMLAVAQAIRFALNLP